MKRQTQVLGVRNWYGDAFVSLQEEPLKVIDSFFSQFGAFVLSGCEVKANGSKYDIAPGLVVLEGPGADNATVKVVVPFAGITATALPVYLTLGYETETDVYNDGNVKPIAHIYKAVATTVKPAGSYVQITRDGGVRFIDAIQDATHRLITDNERTAWNKAIQDVAKYTPFDYVVDSNATLAGLNNNPNATCVLIKKGTWTAPSSGILLHPNTKRIVGQPGSLVQYAGSDSCLKYSTIPSLESGYSAHGVCVKTTGQGHGFVNMVNLEDCKCEGADIYTPDDPYCFFKCKNLTRCSIFIHSKSHQAWGFMECENMLQCNVRSDEYSIDSIGIYHCRNLTQCISDGGIHFSYNVFMCQSSRYEYSYFSSTDNENYKCADTMNGGWNKIITA